MGFLPDRWHEIFEAETLYRPEGWCVHELLDVDLEARTVTARMDTTRLVLVAEQKVLPGHPNHLPAAAAVQASGTLGQLYAVFALNLKVSEGWVGFGTHITKARWGRLGLIGPPVDLRAECTRRRDLWGTIFCDFAFVFKQGGEVVYQSNQTAAWRRGDSPQAGQSVTLT